MIDLIKSTILDNYPNCITTVKNISYDSENDFALCNSEFISINYEKLIKDILKAEHTVPDMLHFHKNKLIFVEFKNAYIHRANDKMRLKLKGIEGNYIGLYNLMKKYDYNFKFTDIFDLDIYYIIVMSKDKIRNSENNNSKLSPGIQYINNYLNKVKGEMKLKYYEGTFFSKVEIVTDEVFMKNYISRLNELDIKKS